ncbi:MAG: 4-hydroxyphenylpyruvate dioxygenase [Vulcanimicrobiota bacterium]
MQAETAQKAQTEDFLPLNGMDHVEFYVGNAKQSAQFYRTILGFHIRGYRGPETGCRDRASYFLEQGKIRFVLTSAIRSDHPVAEHVARHGDGVRVLALEVDDAKKALEETSKRGAVTVQELQEHSDQHGTVRTSAIATYGDTIHQFVERKDYKGRFFPGFEDLDIAPPAGEVGLVGIDHVVGNVELGRMNEWVRFYGEVLGFSQLIHFDDEAISTDYTALMSKVMQNGTGKIKFPINEPAESKKKSQIEEYLDFYGGPGVQHIALITGDIISTVNKLKAQGLEFLTIPHSYYEDLADRVGVIKEKIEDLQDLGILVDRDDEGYLLQIFTRPIQDRPTVFFEVIQRRGSRGFGLGNFKALFEAIEREQARRGNL